MIKTNKGQSTIEFILTFSSTVGFIFLFIKMALNYTNGYMLHHAVFMASRNYLVSDSQKGDVRVEVARDDDAKKEVPDIFEKYMPAGLIKDVNKSIVKVNDPEITNAKAFVGVWAEIEQAFSVGFIGGKDKVTFRSESFLGREPTRFETYSQICDQIMATIDDTDCTYDVTLDDNGG